MRVRRAKTGNDTKGETQRADRDRNSRGDGQTVGSIKFQTRMVTPIRAHTSVQGIDSFEGIIHLKSFEGVFRTDTVKSLFQTDTIKGAIRMDTVEGVACL